MPKVHFIAIGGSIMHNLAIALKEKGYEVTGSDDEFFEPSKSRLEKHGLLPPTTGWDPNRITEQTDQVILGMHAKADNPELQKAQDLGVDIFSFPEYIYDQSQDKQRVVIAGSHGKTSVTSMIMHVLKHCKKNFDYVVGAQLDGFETMVRLTEDAPVIIIEGDEYPSCAIDKTPKFLKYHHHIGLINGIAWDHINVYPTFDDYTKLFEDFAEQTPKSGTLIFNEEDDLATYISRKDAPDVTRLEYTAHKHKIKNGNTYLVTPNKKEVPVKVFGHHNMINIAGALNVCLRLGVTEEEFYKAIQDFKGASKRLEIIKETDECIVFRDFAHAPSKVKATVKAVKSQYENRKLTACLELHTFSSLNKAFLKEYKNSLKAADEAIVFFNPEVIKHKGLAPITAHDIKNNFNDENIYVFTEKDALINHLLQGKQKNNNLLLMSSGSFDKADLAGLAEQLTAQPV